MTIFFSWTNAFRSNGFATFWMIVLSLYLSLARSFAASGSIDVDYSDILTEKPLCGENSVYFEVEDLHDSAGTLTPAAAALNQQIGFEITRFPAGNNYGYDWKRAIGPQASREEQLQWWWKDEGFESIWGPDEGAQFAEANNGTLCIVINSNKDADDAADFVEYMNAPVGQNPNGGIDWAQVRADNGHPEPYGTVYWEISNESGGKEQLVWQNYASSGDDRTQGTASGDATVADRWINGGTRTFTNQRAVQRGGWVKNDTSGVLTSEGNTTAGVANETMYAKFPPIASLSQLKVGSTVWQSVSDISTAGPNDQVYQVLDADEGSILFGDGVHGQLLPSGDVVTLDYVSGPHSGWIDYWQKMKAVDSTIQIVSSTFGIIKYYSLLGAAGVSMDGYQVHGGLSYNNNTTPAGGSYFTDYIGRSYFAYPENMEASRTAMKNNGVPSNVPMVQSEHSVLQMNSGGPAKHWRTLKAGLGHCLMFERAVTQFGQHTNHPISPFMKTSLTLQAQSLEFRNGVLVATGSGLAQQLLIKHFGKNVLTETARSMPEYSIPWQGYDTAQHTGNIPKLVPLASKDADGNLYVLGINTTSAESMTLTVNMANGFDLSNASYESWTLEADSIDADNDNVDPNRIRVRNEMLPPDCSVLNSNSFSFTVLPATARVLKFYSGQMSVSTDVIAGWESSAIGPATTNSGPLTTGLSFVGTVGTDNNRGSTDGTFGLQPGASAVVTSGGFKMSLGGVGADYRFNIAVTNVGVEAVTLASLHFDAFRSYNGSPQFWSVSYKGGDLSEPEDTLIASGSLVAQLTDVVSGVGADYEDFDIGLVAVLTSDTVLFPGERAEFELTIHGQTAANPSPTYLDNIAILGAIGADSDNDGMDDLWELDYFGSLTNNGAGDFDQDGFDDGSEYLAGTNPTNALSLLMIEAFDPWTNSDEFVIRWQSVEDRQYRILSATNLLSGLWATNVSGIMATPPQNIETITNAADRAFFRIELE